MKDSYRDTKWHWQFLLENSQIFYLATLVLNWAESGFINNYGPTHENNWALVAFGGANNRYVLLKWVMTG